MSYGGHYIVLTFDRREGCGIADIVSAQGPYREYTTAATFAEKVVRNIPDVVTSVIYVTPVKTITDVRTRLEES